MADRDYQTKAMNEIGSAWDAGAQNVMCVLPTGSGKCLARGTPVLMFNGTIKPVEDVKVGEFLMGPDSNPRIVMSLARGRENMYRVVPKKGTPYTVNESHILSLKITPERTSKRHVIVNIPVLDYLNKNKTFKHCAKGWRAAVTWDRREVPLDPYFLGLWLGDGSVNRPEISKPDPEIKEYVEGIAKQYGLQVTTHYGSSGCPSYLIGTYPGGRNQNSLKNLMREMNLLNNKHVPLEYKANDEHTRLQVLAGLIDSDGSMSNGGFDFISMYRNLSEDVAYLCRSLGLAAYVSECRKGCQTGAVGTYYHVSISGNCSIIPTRIPRKKAAPRRQIKDVTVTGISLHYQGVDDYFGFELAGPDRLFLLGDFTVTHNTHVFSRIVSERDRPSALIAHRQELVSQAAFALNREQVPHSIIAPQALVSEIIRAEIDMYGKSYYQPRAAIRVAGVNTITVRDISKDKWFQQVEYVVIDEGHHVLKDNVFGKAVQMFPTARGLFPTAHAIRADNRGLGRHADGLVDALVVGPSARQLINRGYLVDYRLICPPSDIDLSQVTIGSTGDFVPEKLRSAMHASSTIVGDVVREYKRFAEGKLGLTFAVDIDAAKEIAESYQKSGIPAAIVTGETSIVDRVKIMRQFRARELLQLVSVDVLGEGTDVPAVEVISMARPTKSFQLYSQQFGRSLRVDVNDDHGKVWDKYTDQQRLDAIATSNKPKAIIIDHVSNWNSPYGLPDKPRKYSLDRREKKAKRDSIPLKLCVNCLEPYESIHKSCPHCGHTPAPAIRNSPEAVEGDLLELDAATLALLRGEVDKIDNPPTRFPVNATPEIIGAIKKRHHQRQESQRPLRAAIALWAGYWKAHGAEDSETYRRFFHMFGSDIMTAQTLGATDAQELESNIRAEIERLNVVERTEAGE